MRPTSHTRAHAHAHPWVRAALLFAAVACALAVASPARACLFSNVASAYADGTIARRVTMLPPTARQEAIWAPFAFQHDFAVGQTLRLREDMREVARSMGPVALRWSVRWYFGDGARSNGVAVMHAYRRPGLYKIAVESYYDGSRGARGWYAFDQIDVAVGPLPPGVMWMGRHT